ncbi:MAG: Nicotinate phosphoribosyltransferase, partial [uncultured Frankineae bacterium]
VDRPAHRPLRADHARSGPAHGAGRATGRVRGVHPPAAGGPPLRRRGGAGPPGLPRAAGPLRRRGAGCLGLPGAASAHLAARPPVGRRGDRLPRGRDLRPRLPRPDRERLLRRGTAARDARAVGPQPRQRGGLRGRPDGARRRGPAAARDGWPAHARAGRGRCGTGGVRRGFRADQQPRGGPPSRRAHRRDERARLHPGPPQRGRGLRLAGRDARHRDDAAGGHLRHRAGHPQRGRRGRDGAGSGAPGQRRPAGGGASGTGAARRARRHRHAHRRDGRPRRALHRGARRLARRHVRRRYLGGHRVRLAHSRFRVQAGGGGSGGRTRRPARARRQAVGRQDDRRGPQVGLPRRRPRRRPVAARGSGTPTAAAAPVDRRRARRSCPVRRRPRRPAPRGPPPGPRTSRLDRRDRGPV